MSAPIDSRAWTGRPHRSLSFGYLGLSVQSPFEACWTVGLGRRFHWTHVGHINIIDLGWIKPILGLRICIENTGRLWRIR